MPAEKGPAVAEIACHLCRRRKVKCDRMLPHCKVCLHTNQVCEYPLHAKKPGPKIGSLQRHKRRYRDREDTAVMRGTSGNASNEHGSSNGGRQRSGRSGRGSRRGLRSGPGFASASEDDDKERDSEDGEAAEGDSNARPHSTASSAGMTTAADWTQRRRNARLNINDLSFILHPSHEASTPDKDASAEGIGAGASHVTVSEPPGPSPAGTSPGRHLPNATANNGKSSYTVALASPEAQQPDFMQRASTSLGVSEAMLRASITGYFANMVAMSLFHQPTFEETLAAVSSSPVQLAALLAAMVGFAVRFQQPLQGKVLPPEQATTTEQTQTNHMPPPPSPPFSPFSPKHFLAMARRFIERALDECGDDPPTLAILQACIICTHCELTHGVHGRAWRSLGMCVRLAYEMNLHLVDAKTFPAASPGDARSTAWRDAEEKRRTWWAIWEMDVYASTIRRTPTAMDWTLMEILLPVDDAVWFDDAAAHSMRRSCFMEVDPVRRWKALQASRNQSSKAWFLVINSLMKDARVISSPRGVPLRQEDSDTNMKTKTKTNREKKSINRSPPRKRYTSPPACPVQEARQKLEILANCVQCFVMALPAHLQYRNQFLSFGNDGLGTDVDSPSSSSSPSPSSSLRQLHCGIYNIFLMTQLSRLMIHRYELFGSHNQHSPPPSSAVLPYFEAADNILAIVNRSCEEHIQHINPFLLSTIWLAAAVQLVRRRHVAIPRAIRESNTHQQALIKSRFDVLYLTYKRCAAFWNVRTAMEQNLEALEAQLERHEEESGEETEGGEDERAERVAIENHDQGQAAGTKRRCGSESAARKRDQGPQKKNKKARVVKDRPSRAAAPTPGSNSSNSSNNNNSNDHPQPSPDTSLEMTTSAPLQPGFQVSPQPPSLSAYSDTTESTSTALIEGNVMAASAYMDGGYQAFLLNNTHASFPFLPMTVPQDGHNYAHPHQRTDSFMTDTAAVPDNMPLTMLGPSLFGSDLGMDDMQQQQYGGIGGFAWRGLDLPMDIQYLLSGYSEY
ncbi:hypothetical protein SCUCBS95973_009237 [Sporothrix curviconia]|uniref:Zn(2)-C6 fungal-type domain-containing protein n=1 Tax=Sporothrix curviconia TaxID=1260050 RepID=A0ABP0CWK4_9PEZI